jgi:hypothetical protein
VGFKVRYPPPPPPPATISPSFVLKCLKTISLFILHVKLHDWTDIGPCLHHDLRPTKEPIIGLLTEPHLWDEWACYSRPFSRLRGPQASPIICPCGGRGGATYHTGGMTWLQARQCYPEPPSPGNNWPLCMRGGDDGCTVRWGGGGEGVTETLSLGERLEGLWIYVFTNIYLYIYIPIQATYERSWLCVDQGDGMGHGIMTPAGNVLF